MGEAEVRRESFAAFSRRVMAAAGRIEMTRAGKPIMFSLLSKRDQEANIDAWYAEGFDPTNDPDRPLPPEPGSRAAVNAPLPDASGETFFGWVQRALVPGPGFEWARLTLPRHVVEGLAEPDKAGRTMRKDTREVMTMEILGELASWELGNRVRKAGGR